MYAGDVGIVFGARRRAAARRRPKSLSSDIRHPCMNSRVHVRAVRAGVSLYKTAVLSVASRVSCRRLEGKETARGPGFKGWREVAQVPVFRQADTYLSKCLHAKLVLQ